MSLPCEHRPSSRTPRTNVFGGKFIGFSDDICRVRLTNLFFNGVGNLYAFFPVLAWIELNLAAACSQKQDDMSPVVPKECDYRYGWPRFVFGQVDLVPKFLLVKRPLCIYG